MPTAEEYQQKAAEYLQMAHATDDITSKSLLLEIAQGWTKLADQMQQAEPARNYSAPAGLK